MKQQHRAHKKIIMPVQNMEVLRYFLYIRALVSSHSGVITIETAIGKGAILVKIILVPK